jgi:hypothetical protein
MDETGLQSAHDVMKNSYKILVGETSKKETIS